MLHLFSYLVFAHIVHDNNWYVRAHEKSYPNCVGTNSPQNSGPYILDTNFEEDSGGRPIYSGYEFSSIPV